MQSEIEQKLWRRVATYLQVLTIVPGVKMVAVCNNLAFGAIDEESDIDLFVVAERGRLFTVRILVTFLLHILGVRRHGGKVAGRFCLSFFVDEDFLDLSEIAIEDDVYLAYWCATLVPVVDRSEDGERFSKYFIGVNSWIGGFFENGFLKKCSAKMCSGKKVLEPSSVEAIYGEALSFAFSGIWGDWFERIMKRWQLRRARAKAKRASGEASLIVDEHILKFHNVDRRKAYREAWIKKYGGKAKLNRERFLSLDVRA